MLITAIEFIAFLSWSVFLFWLFLGVLSLTYTPGRSSVRASNVEMVIVSIANSSVRKSLNETISNIGGLRLAFHIVVDEGSELIPELPAGNIVVVPKTYKQVLIAKGRAISYFIEHYVQNHNWYAFVDDDNLVLDDAFLYEIPYHEQRGYVALNGSFRMRKGKSILAYVMDSIRLFDDITASKFFTGVLGRPLAGLHGELLCVKGETLKEIGYNHRTITEDFRFSYELVRRNYRTWRSKTQVSLKSPNNLSDLMRQRGRWFKGIILDLKDATSTVKLVMGLRVVFWMLSFFGSWAFAFLWPIWGAFWPALPGGIAYWLVYSYGVSKTRRWSFLFLIPAIGVIETLSWIYCFKQKGFFVVDKG